MGNSGKNTRDKSFVGERRAKLKQALMSRLAAGATGIVLSVAPVVDGLSDAKASSHETEEGRADVTERLNRVRAHVELQEPTNREDPEQAEPTSTKGEIIAQYRRRFNNWRNYRRRPSRRW